MGNFDEISRFYDRHSGSIGCLWILKRNHPHRYRQMVINAVFSSIFVMAWIPTMIDIVRTPTIETLAVSINMCSSAANDFVLFLVMTIYRDDVRMLLEWCEELHARQKFDKMMPMAEKIFKKCRREVVFYQRRVL